MSKLATLAANDSNAAVAMAWLLIPGAKRLGSKLSDLAHDIDGLIAGQLWVEIRTHGGSSTKAVASTILRNVERGIQAEYGIGDYGARADKTWAMTHVSDAIGDSASPAAPATTSPRCSSRRGSTSRSSRRGCGTPRQRRPSIPTATSGRTGMTPHAPQSRPSTGREHEQLRRRHVGRQL